MYSIRSLIIVVGRTKSDSLNDNNKGIEIVTYMPNCKELPLLLSMQGKIVFCIRP
jgi:hypothetical protein